MLKKYWKKKMNSKNLSFFIILSCVFLCFGIILTGYNDFQKLKSSQSALENYKSAPKNLLDPDISPSSVNTANPVLGTLIIPKIDIEWSIRSDTVNAYDSVYHYPESVMPGQNGDCGILGHRTRYSGPFNKIGSLKPGDLVIIEDPSSSKKYTYQVVSNGEDIRWDYETNPIQFAQSGEANLLLITCYPPGKKEAAWITHCKLISTTDI
jgi:sortase A